jgi:hypothetical protein
LLGHIFHSVGIFSKAMGRDLHSPAFTGRPQEILPKQEEGS